MITLAALCAVGAEKVLANEIKQLGYVPVSHAPGRVVFTGNDESVYRTNIWLRTADRVYLQAASFPASDFDALFEGVKAVRWQDYFPKQVRVVVDKVRTFRSTLSSEHSVQAVVHKAIYSRLGEAWHMTSLPETGEQASVRVYIEKDTAFVLLDLSGQPLHRRGYRTAGGEAPIRETLAAVLLQLMCWKRKTPLHDPFCGSGTIPIEAALYAYNIAPGLGRSFAFEQLSFFDAGLYAEVRRDAASQIRPDCLARITGSDIDPAAVRRAQANAERALVTAGRVLQTIGSDARIPRPDFICSGFQELAVPYETGLLIGNPPYGERLGSVPEAEMIYRGMSSLFGSFAGWSMGFITDKNGFESCIGRKAQRKKSLKSGNLDTVFYMYDAVIHGGNNHGDNS